MKCVVTKPVMLNRKVYEPGAILELTIAEAANLSWCVEIADVPASPKAATKTKGKVKGESEEGSSEPADESVAPEGEAVAEEPAEAGESITESETQE